jgi:hypothetical protein
MITIPSRGRTMRRHTLISALATTMMVAGLAACATHGHADSPRTHAITVQVINNLALPTSMDIYMIGPAGIQQRLGFIPGNDSAEFSFRPDSYGQRYRLMGKRQLGRPFVSQPFTIGDAQTRYVVWTLLSNMVTLYNGVATGDTVLVDSTATTKP